MGRSGTNQPTDRVPTQICAQTELRREERLVADLDVARATRAMFEFERGGMADVLLAGTVRPEEFAGAGPMTS
jgi:hypothetical protein